MKKLNVFNFMSLDGYFSGPGGDFSWHEHDEEGMKFSMESSKSGNTLLFGRKTYQIMESFWPTPQAQEMNPVVAQSMNSVEKIVFSKTLKKVTWNNSKVINGNIEAEVKKLKETSAKDMTILGSGTIVTQLADAGLIDEFTFMLDPLALGEGTSVFKGLKNRLKLNLKSVKQFKNGTVLLSYGI
jgi:dihydrofolate reductase